MKNTSGKKTHKLLPVENVNPLVLLVIIHSFSIIFSRYESLARNLYCCQKKFFFKTILSLKVYGNLKCATNIHARIQAVKQNQRQHMANSWMRILDIKYSSFCFAIGAYASLRHVCFCKSSIEGQTKVNDSTNN